MDNPFESGHIKNYVLAYASIVVIMVLFFVASSLFIEEKEIDKKVFKENPSQSLKEIREKVIIEQNSTRKYKLLENGY